MYICMWRTLPPHLRTYLQACRPPSGASAQTFQRTQRGPQPGGETQAKGEYQAGWEAEECISIISSQNTNKTILGESPRCSTLGLGVYGTTNTTGPPFTPSLPLKHLHSDAQSALRNPCGRGEEASRQDCRNHLREARQGKAGMK